MFKIETTLDVEFNAQDVVIGLSDLKIVNLVKELELEAESWDVTILLARHFERLMAAAKLDAPEEFLTMSEDALLAKLIAEDAAQQAELEANDPKRDGTT